VELYRASDGRKDQEGELMAKQAAAGLSGFIQRSGEARAVAGEPRGVVSVAEVAKAPVQPVTLPAPTVSSPSLSVAVKGQGIRALTLRVDNELYDRLRRYAFDQELTHQQVLEVALRGHLEAQGR
jgi:hypothetical protein